MSDGEAAAIPLGDLEALLAIAAWTAREHAGTLPAALLEPAMHVLARYDVHLEEAPQSAPDQITVATSDFGALLAASALVVTGEPPAPELRESVGDVLARHGVRLEGGQP